MITIEALGSAANPHPLQERIAKLHGSQCGFCTPGIVMSLYALLRNAYDPETRTYRLSEEMVELEGALDGNLCRCTGYKPILDAAKSFVKEDLGGVVVESSRGAVVERPENELGGNWTASQATGSCGRPGGCCRDKPGSPSSDTSSDVDSASTEITEQSNGAPVSGSTYGAPLKSSKREDGCQLSSGASKCATEAEVLSGPKGGKHSFPQFNFKAYEPHTEIICPPGLQKYVKQPICFGNSKKIWFRPTTLAHLLEIKDAFPSAKMVAGSSEVQVEIRFKQLQYAVAVYVGDIEELKSFTVDEGSGTVIIGGNTPLTVMEQGCLEWYRKLGKRGMVLEAIRKQLRYFAGRQVSRSFASCLHYVL